MTSRLSSPPIMAGRISVSSITSPWRRAPSCKLNELKLARELNNKLSQASSVFLSFANTTTTRTQRSHSTAHAAAPLPTSAKREAKKEGDVHAIRRLFRFAFFPLLFTFAALQAATVAIDTDGATPGIVAHNN